MKKYKAIDRLITAVSIIIFLLLINLSLLDSFDFNSYDFTAYIFGALMLCFILRADRKTTFAIFSGGMVYYIIVYYISRPDIFKIQALLPLLVITICSYYFSYSREDINFKLYTANYLLKEQSLSDPLTGLKNRRFMSEFLDHQIAVFNRQKTPFSIIFADIDHFKKVNDLLGHNAGDDILKEFAALLKNESREIDFVIRYGGEEFMMILTDTRLEQAEIIAERIRLKTQNYDFTHVNWKITASFGITEIIEGDNSETIIARSDSNLYYAKRNGRNLCCPS